MTYFGSNCAEYEQEAIDVMTLEDSDAHGGGSGGNDIEKSSDEMDG